MDSPILAIKNLWANYHGQPLIQHINLTIERASIVGIVGTIGAGKSLLAQCLLQLHPPTIAITSDYHHYQYDEYALDLTHADQGLIIYDGIPISQYSRQAIAAKIQTVFQDALGA